MLDAGRPGHDQVGGQADEQAVLDDPGAPLQRPRQRLRLVERRGGAVEQVVALVGLDRPAGPRRDGGSGRSPSASRNGSCVRQPKGVTSSGRAWWVPRRSDSLDASTTMTSRVLAWATIFSRSSAPPPPLIRRSCGSTSSAPSMVRSIDGRSSRRHERQAQVPRHRRDPLAARRADDVAQRRPRGTGPPGGARPAARWSRRPGRRPCPGSTSSTARSAAWRFRSSCVHGRRIPARTPADARLRTWPTPASPRST